MSAPGRARIAKELQRAHWYSRLPQATCTRQTAMRGLLDALQERGGGRSGRRAAAASAQIRPCAAHCAARQGTLHGPWKPEGAEPRSREGRAATPRRVDPVSAASPQQLAWAASALEAWKQALRGPFQPLCSPRQRRRWVSAPGEPWRGAVESTMQAHIGCCEPRAPRRRTSAGLRPRSSSAEAHGGEGAQL